MCKRTHCVQNYTGVPFAFNMKKFLSLEIFYTHAVTDVTDKYEVWGGGGSAGPWMDGGFPGWI